MALVASLQDGKFVTSTASSTSLSTEKEKNASGMDSDAFLTLLVAEMKNQDPLEPTANTEWISQYATFTQVSEIQEIGNDMTSMKAQDLVGEYVIMKVTNASGNTEYVSGKVDYVVYENGKAYLSIEDSLYSIDDLDTVASSEYMDAYDMAKKVADAIGKWPALENVTSSDKKSIEEVYEICEGMTDYQKTFLDKSVFDKVDEYHEKLESILKTSESEETKDEETDS